jgi:hypothetical protein
MHVYAHTRPRKVLHQSTVGQVTNENPVDLVLRIEFLASPLTRNIRSAGSYRESLYIIIAQCGLIRFR